MFRSLKLMHPRLGLALFVIGVGLASPATAEIQKGRLATDVVRQLPGQIYGSARARSPLTGPEALKRIKSGQSVYVGLNIGKLRRGSLPRRMGKVYIDRHPSVSDHDHAIKREYLSRQRTRVKGVDALLRLNATDQLTRVDTSASLSEAEQKVARVFGRLAGGIHGSARISWVFDDFHRPAYKVKVRGPGAFKAREGLFDPGRKVGGFLGLFRRPARLSVLEATDYIVNQGKTVQIQRNGKANTVRSVGELADYLSF